MQSGLILQATDAQAVRTDAAVYVGTAAVEVQVEATTAIHRTAPVGAVAACVDEHAIAGVAATCRDKLQGGGKGAVITRTGPGRAFRFKFRVYRQSEAGGTRVVDAGYALPQAVVLRAPPIVGR